MNLGNNKQNINNFAVEFISLNYSIMYMYLSFLFLNLSTNVSDCLSFPSIDILIRASKFLWVNLDLRGVLIKFIYEKLLSLAHLTRRVM